MNDMNLRRGNKINQEAITKPVKLGRKYPAIKSLECRKHQITATLSDGRIISIPKAWFKRLREATEKQLNDFEITPSGYGIHWEELDEDISVKAFVEGIN
ncbi:MAG: hypothetical protein MRECE_14c014 [Mycoplasmataceae bacterium CE_OT135]|nr:MAG: hypothetical protein MRECE_14c014 [Mycoplasmataceae bacterium CE_OT135]